VKNLIGLGISLSNIFDKIFNQKDIKEKPPVLIDIGASEKIHYKWKKIAGKSICLAFDADDRDFQFVEKEQNNFKQLFIYNCIALDKTQSKVDFFLTKSPYCSSILQPNLEKLESYLHHDLFKVEKKVQLNSIHIQDAIDNANLDYIDWFKSDSQGIDLRLFNSLNEKIREKVLVAEFEPGIIDAYIGEDKLYSVIKELTENGFWLSDLNVKGIPRLHGALYQKEFKGNIFKKLVKESLKKAPGWGEMSFINNFESELLGSREYILGWLFSTLERHHSFAFVLADGGYRKFRTELFTELKHYSKQKIKTEVYSLKFLPSLFDLIKKKLAQ